MHPPADDPSLDPRRRALLRQAAALPLVAAGTRLFAAAPGLPRLLMVFLRGACDMASVLVPTGSDDYLAVRPRIAIARPGSGPEAALALPGLGADWGLAPRVLSARGRVRAVRRRHRGARFQSRAGAGTAGENTGSTEGILA